MIKLYLMEKENWRMMTGAHIMEPGVKVLSMVSVSSFTQQVIGGKESDVRENPMGDRLSMRKW